MHKLRNLSKYINNKKAHRKELYQDAKMVYEAEGRMDAVNKVERFIRERQPKEPKAVKNFITDIDDSLTFYEFDQSLWKFLKSTNPLESYLKEICRRVRLVDSFRDERSCDTLVFALVKRYNDHRRKVPLFKKTKFTQRALKKLDLQGWSASGGLPTSHNPLIFRRVGTLVRMDPFWTRPFTSTFSETKHKFS